MASRSYLNALGLVLGWTGLTLTARASASFLIARGQALSFLTFIPFLSQPSLGPESICCGSNTLYTFENPDQDM